MQQWEEKQKIHKMDKGGAVLQFMLWKLDGQLVAWNSDGIWEGLVKDGRMKRLAL